MTIDKKLYAALALLALLGGGLYLANKKEKEDATAHSIGGQAAEMPKIEITEEQTKGIDKIVLTKAADGDGGAGHEIELVKEGEDWKLTRPVQAKANQANVKSLLDNLKTLKVVETIDSGKSSYEKFGVAEGKGLHAVFSKGAAPVLDVTFGDSGGRGQMTRVAGKDGVYAVKGYSSYLYGRDVKGFRDMSLFKFEDTAVTAVSIDNENGSFSFTKEGEAWKAKHKAPKAAAAKDLEKFEESKIKDMLRAYKSLNADGFAEAGKTDADVGLDKPVSTVVFTLSDGAKREVKVGANAEGSSRWIKASGHDDIFSISSWAADWATAEPKKFQKAEKKDKDKEGEDAPEMPGMPGMPGMPPGMGMGHGGPDDPH